MQLYMSTSLVPSPWPDPSQCGEKGLGMRLYMTMYMTGHGGIIQVSIGAENLDIMLQIFQGKDNWESTLCALF